MKAASAGAYPSSAGVTGTVTDGILLVAFSRARRRDGPARPAILRRGLALVRHAVGRRRDAPADHARQDHDGQDVGDGVEELGGDGTHGDTEVAARRGDVDE